MNQASMFFTALVMLAGAGWYMLASHSPPAGETAATSAQIQTEGRLVAKAPAPSNE